MYTNRKTVSGEGQHTLSFYALCGPQLCDPCRDATHSLTVLIFATFFTLPNQLKSPSDRSSIDRSQPKSTVSDTTHLKKPRHFAYFAKFPQSTFRENFSSACTALPLSRLFSPSVSLCLFVQFSS